MVRRCPNPQCLSPRPHRHGTFFRASDSKTLRKWRCIACKRCFSDATFERPFRHHKRRANAQVQKLLSSGVSMRRIALLLNLNRATVVRKLAFLSETALERHQHRLASLPKAAHIQFDDLRTVEHTKCKPLSITLAVEKDTRRILGFEVSRIPAFGPLADFSRKKYGPRPNERPQAVRRLFEAMKSAAAPGAEFSSDEDSLYPGAVQRAFPGAVHHRYPGGRGCITGQGELKKLRFDPLFSLNHTCAMLRANINRLFRRTWCTTKKPEWLARHLAVYMDFHNTVLIRA
jgi:transposase-like protein